MAQAAAGRLAPPRERTVTLPQGIPKLTLGWGAIAWVTDNLLQPNGPLAGQPFRMTEGQVRFTLWFYALDPEGRWLHNRAVRRLAKGSGKSPFAGVLSLTELLGPVRLDHFDPDAPGGCVGRPVSMPLVQIAATSERQTANTMRMVRAMASKRSPLAKKYGLQVGKTFVDAPGGGKLEQITSSEGTAEGAEVSFVVGDETEHWTPGMGGPGLMETLTQNAVKTGARVMETSNAWVPGAGSVAESTFEAWCAQQEGLTRATQTILYDARVAPAITALTDDPDEGEISLSEGLRFVYEDCPWVDIEPIKQTIWATNYPTSRARRFFLNQPNAAENAWTSVQEWSRLSNPDRDLVDGEEVVLFFDGSKSNDHTALVGCCMDDGHVFTLGVWKPERATGVVNAGAVDSAVHAAFDRFTVVAFWADVREWESYVKDSWPREFGDDLLVWAVPRGKEPAPIAWDMRSHVYQFAEAAEMCLAEIQARSFTHDGNWATSEHVANARVNETRGRFSIKKESPKSSKKIDAAVCVIGARMVYRAVKASPEWEDRSTNGSEWGLF
ncbi:putative phage terminase, large subunit [Actinomyces urogenitalis DSM 15434]|uniref:Putative phage terminase, large subunit n=1 Tax=Actinomyces urogenitalis DSM 15434 TaxID=525246 RepID=C0W4E7_9ACTO|nr:putative phage terminase, large subunit [Actinomyces urogenitalis DSM 15434]